MKKTRTLILTDNPYACDLAFELNELYGDIEVFQSPNGTLKEIRQINVRKQTDHIISSYDLVISIHCKQLFPAKLVNGIRCINVHPGLNPHNRGWYPQVFSIINGLPSGVTIHEIDEDLDHGPIIAQQAYEIQSWDTSGSAYKKIMAIERALVLEHFVAIRDRNYEAITPSQQGNLNYKKDFEELREIDLNATATFGQVINRLRALTHDNFNNAYFSDPAGNKVFVKITLEKSQ